MELSGLVVGMGTVLSIYLSRALCIWGVGYFGRSFWVVFLVLGLLFLGLVLWLGDGLAAELLSVAGFCCGEWGKASRRCGVSKRGGIHDGAGDISGCLAPSGSRRGE